MEAIQPATDVRLVGSANSHSYIACDRRILAGPINLLSDCGCANSRIGRRCPADVTTLGR